VRGVHRVIGLVHGAEQSPAPQSGKRFSARLPVERVVGEDGLRRRGPGR
jgi:hypothetical protein